MEKNLKKARDFGKSYLNTKAGFKSKIDLAKHVFQKYLKKQNGGNTSQKSH